MNQPIRAPNVASILFNVKQIYIKPSEIKMFSPWA